MREVKEQFQEYIEKEGNKRESTGNPGDGFCTILNLNQKAKAEGCQGKKCVLNIIPCNNIKYTVHVLCHKSYNSS